MTKNILVFNWEQDYGENITFACNNHKDLEDYINKNYNWYNFVVHEDYVSIVERPGFSSEIATLTWTKLV